MTQFDHFFNKVWRNPEDGMFHLLRDENITVGDTGLTFCTVSFIGHGDQLLDDLWLSEEGKLNCDWAPLKIETCEVCVNNWRALCQ